jgi:hypothetical protein
VIPDLPKEVDDLIMNAVAVKPDDRFASARDMIGYLDQMSTKSCPPERLTEYLRYLYPHADFNPPPVPVYENDERDAPAASEYSMVIAMSEEGAKSVFGRGELPIEWTRQFALKDLQQGLEQARAEQARLEQERVDRDQARRNKQRERAERPATIEPSLHDPAGITDPRHGDPRMLVAVDEEHDLIPPTAASVSGVVDDSPTTIAQASGALPAGVLADSEATAYARPPAPQRKQQAEVSTRPTIAQSAVVEDRFRDEEMTVMMDAPPSKRGTPWAGEDLTREEIHAPTKVGGGLTTPIVISPESSSQATQPSQPAFSRDNRDSRDRDDKRAKRDIQERKRPGGATAKPAAVMRKTVGFENASKEPPIAPAATPRRPAYMEQSETDELLQSPPEPTPNWLLLGLILMGITIVILLIVLLIQKT